MEPLGFIALPEAGEVWLQQCGSDEGVALSAISLDGTGVRMGDPRLSRGRVRCLWVSLCGGGGSLAQIGRARLRTSGSAASRLVLSHFSYCLFPAHRIHGIALSCVPARFAPVRAQRTLVDGRIIRRALLDDAANWHHSVADTRDRGSASVPRN